MTIHFAQFWTYIVWTSGFGFFLELELGIFFIFSFYHFGHLFYVKYVYNVIHLLFWCYDYWNLSGIITPKLLLINLSQFILVNMRSFFFVSGLIFLFLSNSFIFYPISLILLCLSFEGAISVFSNFPSHILPIWW